MTNIITATRRAINARTRPKKRGGATKHQLREVLESTIPPSVLLGGFRATHIHDIREATADQLHELNYAFAWGRAWGRTVEEFYAEGGMVG
jgi:hypothetical protein